MVSPAREHSAHELHQNSSSTRFGCACGEAFASWDVQQVADFDGMFRGSNANPNLGSWNFAAATSMVEMFLGNVVDVLGMFRDGFRVVLGSLGVI